MNRYEGGCKFPYLSEVARNGLGWWSFFIGTTIGCLPWILFSIDYFQTFKHIAMSFNNSTKRILFILKQYVCGSSCNNITLDLPDLGYYFSIGNERNGFLRHGSLSTNARDCTLN